MVTLFAGSFKITSCGYNVGEYNVGSSMKPLASSVLIGSTGGREDFTLSSMKSGITWQFLRLYLTVLAKTERAVSN